jgi:acyl CoA:acetate/3-ketoacid CoA transferase alpha subunit
MGDIAPQLSLQRSMIYGAIRIPVYYCRTYQGIMAKAKKACQHIHGRAFVVNDQILFYKQD